MALNCKNVFPWRVSWAASPESKNVVVSANWFERQAVEHLVRTLQAATGLRSDKSGYDGLLHTAAMVSRRFTPAERRRLVIESLENAFPPPLLSSIRLMTMPPTKFSRQLFALFTVTFFRWLVGPCEVVEREFGGHMERNVVHITKCSVLEGTKCIGICTNMCKMPCQSFIKESLGMPINIVPNFDEMSCEMVFGEDPPPESSDPAFSAPCYERCTSSLLKHKNIDYNIVE